MTDVHPVLRIAAICLLAFLVVQPLAAKSYPMVCKGGGEMVVRFSHVKDSGGFHSTSVAIEFKKSRAAASGSEPAPGHCAWVDRPISAEEPSMLAYAPGAGKDFYFDFKADSWQLTKTEDAGLEQILNALRRGGKFYVRCHREGKFLRVDGVGP
jgi:hypothetical protein